MSADLIGQAKAVIGEMDWNGLHRVVVHLPNGETIDMGMQTPRMILDNYHLPAKAAA